MYSGRSMFLVVVLMFVPATGLFADKRGVELVESEFQDWSGSLEQVTLPDGSVLSEYIAHSYSGSTEGASLQLSFSPRFNCTPMVGFVIREPDDEINTPEMRVTLILDASELDFPALLDQHESALRYSYNADMAAQQNLRVLLDTSSRATIQWEMPGKDGTDAGEAESIGHGTVTFSLLGSRKSVQSVESHCKSHVPIPFGE